MRLELDFEMSQVYSKITLGIGLASLLLYGFYKRFLHGDQISISSSPNSLENARKITQDMLNQMQRTQQTIRSLQREIEALRAQIDANTESITAIRPRESVTVAVGTDDDVAARFEQTEYASRVNSNYARSTQVHFITKRNEQVDTVEVAASAHTVISSFDAPTPASDDDMWKTPSASESDGSEQFDRRNLFEREIDNMASACVASLESLHSRNSMGEDYKYICADIPNYTPLPSSHLPISVRNFITKIDKLCLSLCPEVDENVETAFDLLMNHSDLETCLELVWRVARISIYLKTVHGLLKNAEKAKKYLKAGLDYSSKGIEMMKTLAPYTEATEELKVTALAPMSKWAGSMIGVSAEVAPGVNEKINAGFKSRDLFKQALEYDPMDFYVYYNLARWHYEIYKLPSLLKRSANWISSEPFNSTIDDVIPLVEKSISNYPNHPPMTVVPADLYLLRAQCAYELNNTSESKRYAKLAAESMKHYNDGSLTETFSILDRASGQDISKLL